MSKADYIGFNTGEKQQAFWSALMKRLDEIQSPVRRRKPHALNWMEFAIGRTNFVLGGWLKSAETWIGVYLNVVGPDAPAHFGLLQQQREEIEEELGRLDWEAVPGRESHLVVLRKHADPMQQEDWPNQIDWMVSTLEGFHKTFRPRVKSLNASDWQP